MSTEEYEKAKQERDKRDKKASIIIFPIMFLTLVSCIVWLVLYG